MPELAAALTATTTTSESLSGAQVLSAVNDFHTLYSDAWSSLSTSVIGIVTLLGVVFPVLLAWFQTLSFEKQIKAALSEAKQQSDAIVAESEKKMASKVAELGATSEQRLNELIREIARLRLEATDQVDSKVGKAIAELTEHVAQATSSLREEVAKLEAKAARAMTELAEANAAELVRLASAQQVQIWIVFSQVAKARGSFSEERTSLARAITHSLDGLDGVDRRGLVELLATAIGRGSWDAADAAFLTKFVSELRAAKVEGASGLADLLASAVAKRQAASSGRRR